MKNIQEINIKKKLSEERTYNIFRNKEKKNSTVRY